MIVKESIFKPMDQERVKDIKSRKPMKAFWSQFSSHFDVGPYFNPKEKGKHGTAFIFSFDTKMDYDEDELTDWIEENTEYDVHYTRKRYVNSTGQNNYTGSWYFLYRIFVLKKGIEFNWR